MRVNNSDVKRWFKIGRVRNASHLLVIGNKETGRFYPVFLRRGENLRNHAAAILRRSKRYIQRIYAYQDTAIAKK